MIILLYEFSYAIPVGLIEIRGAKTQEKVIRQLLDTLQGQEFSQSLWDRDLQRLKNLDFFYDVHAEIHEEDGRKNILLNIKNKFSTIPIIKYKRGGGSLQVTAGLYEVNFLNRLLEVGGQYERLNQNNGLVFWFRHPYFLSRKNHVGTEIYVHTLDLPLLTIRGTEEAFLDNKEVLWNARIQRKLSDRLQAGVEFSLYQNDLALDNSSTEKTQKNNLFVQSQSLNSGRTVSLTPRLTFGVLNRDRHYVTGNEIYIQAEVAHLSLGSQFNFVKGLIGATGGIRAIERLNLTYQFKMGSKTGREFQHKFYLGGLDTVRGFLDRQFRGEHMWLLNLEARPTLMEKPLWVLQGNLFTDLSKSWDATNFGIDGFGKPFVSYGAGIRLILPKVYRAIIRFDLARTEQPIQQIGLNFGIQQFF